MIFKSGKAMRLLVFWSVLGLCAGSEIKRAGKNYDSRGGGG